MATNPFFTTVTGGEVEQELHESIVIEHIQMFGFDVLYVPMVDFEIDSVFQEVTKASFKKSYPIEVYSPQTGDTDGDQNIMSKFGFRVSKTVELLMSKKRFSEIGTGQIRPLEGDLVYIGNPDNPSGSFMNDIFEITQVTYQVPEYPLGAHYVYKLFCELYTPNYDKFETNLEALDGLNIPNQDELDRFQTPAAIASIKPSLIDFDKNNPLTGI